MWQGQALKVLFFFFNSNVPTAIVEADKYGADVMPFEPMRSLTAVFFFHLIFLRFVRTNRVAVV